MHKNSIRKDNQLSEQLISNRKQNLKRRKKKKKKNTTELFCQARNQLRLATEKQGASQLVPVVKNPPANAGDKRDVGFTPGSRRFPGGGNGTSLDMT